MSDVSGAGDELNAFLAGEGVDVPLPERKSIRIRKTRDKLARIELPGAGRNITLFSRELAAILRDGSEFFVRDGEVVRVDDEARMMMPVGARAFRTLVEDYVECYSVSHGTKGSFDFTETMALETAATVLESSAFKRGLYEVERIHEQRLPTMRSDGRIELLQPGLDVEAKVYTLESAIDYAVDMPLAEAQAVLRYEHSEFPIGDWDGGGWQGGKSRSFSVHASAMLSQYGWCLIPPTEQRQGFLYYSNSERSGKSLMAEIALTITHGLVATTSWKKDDEKMSASLDVAVRNRSPYVFFDNLKGHIASEELEGFMTGGARKVRLFHTQIERIFPNRASVFITGNNLTWSGDIGGRVLVCDLYLEDADPQSRKVKNPRNGKAFLEQRLRGSLLSALWALVREWAAAGRPACSGSRAGFQKWCATFGGIAEFAGFGNPLEARPDELGGGNTDFSDMLALVERLATGVESVADYRFEDVVSAALEVKSFEWLMKGREKFDDYKGVASFILDASERKKFSHILSQVYGGRAFRLADGRQIRWGNRGQNRGRHYQVVVL